MDVSIQNFSAKLSELFARQWPEALAAIEFVPLYDLGLGHIGTDAPTRLARKVLHKPEALALDIKSLWEQEGGVPLEATRGFLNARLTPEQLLQTESIFDVALPLPEKRVTVLVPPCTEAAERAAHLRLVLRGYLQAYCAQLHGAQVQLVLVGQGAIPLSFGREALSHLIDSVLAWPLQSVSLLIKGVEAELNTQSAADEKKVLWLLPATIPAPQFKTLFPRTESVSQLTLSYVGAAWANWHASERELASLIQMAARLPIETLMYLCSEVVGTDIDLMVPQLKEKANPMQYAALTVDRLKTLLVPGLKAINRGGQPQGQWLHLLLRLRYFYSFERQAGRLGQVAEFVSVLTEIMECSNALCNQPTFRAQLAAGACDRTEIKILTGVLDLLSDIISGRYISGVQKI